MRVPKFFFRNLPSEPRRFKFRSPLYDEREGELEKRRQRLDAEMAAEQALKEGREPERVIPEKISFDRTRRKKNSEANKWRMIRTLIILALLIYLFYRGIIWVETTDFGNVLDTLKNG